MSRVKSGVVTHARHRKVIKAAAGYYGSRSRNFRTATQAVDKANQYAKDDLIYERERNQKIKEKIQEHNSAILLMAD